MKRRLNNDGNIYLRKDGRWVASISFAGKRITRYAKTESDAVAKLNELKGQVFTGSLSVPTDITLSQWIAQWLAIKQPNLRPSSYSVYRQALSYVSVIIGDLPLHKLTPLNLSLAFVQMQKEHDAPRRVNLCHGYLRQCLDYAVNMEILGKNPMLKVAKPKWTPQHREYWSLEQVDQFIETALQHPGKYSPLFVLMVTTGMRISEALGLTWKDVDLEQRKVRISRALVWVPRLNYVEMPPKSAAGKREITLMDATIRALERVPRGSGCIFQTINGTPPNPFDIKERLTVLCKKAGVPFVNVHGLRHVHAMMALEAVRDPYLVQQRLGHSSVAVTLLVYGYPTRDESQIADELNKRLGQG